MDLLLLVALLSDLFTPILIWKFGLPDMLRFIGHIAVFIFIVTGFLRLRHAEHVPKAISLIIATSVIGIAVALINGQSLNSTAWGWWLMLKFPLVGLTISLNRTNWLENFSKRATVWCIAMLWLEVIVQIWQYLGGEVPGDQLAGTFGPNGTAMLVLVLLLTLALALGELIVRKKLWQLVMVISLCIVSSLLGDIRMFFYATAFMGGIVLTIVIWRSDRPILAVPFALVVGTIIYAFPILYDKFIPSANVFSFFDYLSPQVTSHYFNGIIGYSSKYGYDVGRNYMLQYVWHQSDGDLLSRLVGFGLGARGVSTVFGSVGISLVNSDLGIATGASLAVIMGEMGVFGLLVLTGFLVWVIIKLWKASAVERDQRMAVVQYGLLIYTLLMPLWLWYTTAWTQPVPMLLYWTMLGYQFRRFWQQSPDKEIVRSSPQEYPNSQSFTE